MRVMSSRIVNLQRAFRRPTVDVTHSRRISSRSTSACAPWTSSSQAQGTLVFPMHALDARGAAAAGGDSHKAESLFVQIDRAAGL